MELGSREDDPFSGEDLNIHLLGLVPIDEYGDLPVVNRPGRSLDQGEQFGSQFDSVGGQVCASCHKSSMMGKPTQRH